jgi:hypothetical protein
MLRHRVFPALILALMLIAVPALPAPGVLAQGSSHTFPETGKTVSGIFWTYWQQHGGLAQQGYPISDEMQEKSDLNGQTYTVQYFERAVFEKHPENQPPFDVLLSQLGTFRYQQKYGTAGAPGQRVSTDNPYLFKETNHTVGGAFRTYWETHGGLAQQGYPISDEFTEVSDLNNQPYTVQYFERAVFELHPENQPPFNVLLSQLGTFQQRAKTAPTPTATPTNTPTPPPKPHDPCADVPASKDATVSPSCGTVDTTFNITMSGFAANEAISFWFTAPNGKVAGTAAPLPIGGHGSNLADRVQGAELQVLAALIQTPVEGNWAITYAGEKSQHQSIAWIKIIPKGSATAPPPGNSGCDNIPASTNQTVTPNCGPAGTVFVATGWGFKPGEKVGVYSTRPSGSVFGAPFQVIADGAGRVTEIGIRTTTNSEPGIWACTMEGTTTHAKSIGFFKVTKP